MPMPLPFNKALDLKLLKLVKENSILYNMKHPKFSDFDYKEVVWQKIGDSLSRPAPFCKTRWINIRDMMRRKIRERMRNKKRRYYKYKYEDELSFLLPFFKESNSANEDYSEYFEEEPPCSIEMSDYFNDNTKLDIHNSEVKSVINNKQFQEDGNSCSFSGCESTYQELNPADPLDVFLITIGATLRKFSPYYQNQAKSKIFQVIQDYELQQILNKEQIPHSNDANR